MINQTLIKITPVLDVINQTLTLRFKITLSKITPVLDVINQTLNKITPVLDVINQR